MTSPIPTVLILEDDADVLEATTLLLEAEGFRVLGANRIEPALELARATPHAVVLLDLSVMHVDDFVPSLRALPEWRGQVLIFSAGDRLAERAHAMGADGAVSKPFDVERLVVELHERMASVSADSAHAY